MASPNNFNLNTDYATLKNDASSFGSVSIPSNVSVPGGGFWEAHFDVPIGKAGAVTRSRIRSNKVGNRWRIGGATDVLRFGTNDGFTALYDVYSFVWQPAPNVTRFSVLIQNPYSTTLTGEGGVETIDFYTNTFLPPFA